MNKDGLTYFLIGDHLGSTSLTTDANGILASEMKYTAWGEVRESNGTTLTNYTYTGQYSHVNDFGLLYYNARWYDPYLNHFTQPDTIVPDPYNPQDYDRYAYARNNPVKYTDPSGHDPITVGLLLLAAAALLTGCVSTPPEIQSTVNTTRKNGTHYSLGTQINSNTTLTHNHFNVPLTSLNINGQPLTNFNAIGSPVASSQGYKPETGLITTNLDLPGSSSQLASQHVISSLGKGSLVDVVYWDDANSKIAMGSFAVQEPSSNGFIVLNDPNQTINPGDSGGGVFYQHQLIGNTLGINSFKIWVATLPSEVIQSSEATSPVEPQILHNH